MKLLRPLRERDFALLWTGMTVSLLGDGIFLVAEAWQVYDIDNDPVALSLVGLAWTSGMTAFLLTGGIVSDRMDRRRVLIAADLVRAAVLVGDGRARRSPASLEIWHLVALAVLYGRGRGLLRPGLRGARARDRGARAPRRGQLARRSSCARRASGCWGRRSAGSWSRPSAPGGAFLVDAGTFAHERRLHLEAAGPLAAAPGAERSARRELGEAVVFVRSQPWLWATLVAASLSLLLFLGPLEVLLPFIVRNDLDAGAWGYGAILAAAGAGAVARLAGRQPARRAAALPDLRLRRVDRRHPALHRLRLRHGAVAVHGASPSSSARCETAGMVVWGTLMSSRVPPELRGRVHSLDWFVSIGLTPVSFALTGPVSKAIGIDATLVLAGVLPMVVCVVLYVVAGLRRDEDLHPLLGDADAYAGAGASAADSGSGTPAIS